MVGPSGFEPETFCTPSKRATRLRYGPTKGQNKLVAGAGFEVRKCVPIVRSRFTLVAFFSISAAFLASLKLGRLHVVYWGSRLDGPFRGE